MRLGEDRLLRRGACVVFAASSILACSFSFDADELTSGDGGSTSVAGRAGSSGGAGRASAGAGGTAGSAAGGSGKAGSSGDSSVGKGGSGGNAAGGSAGSAGRGGSGQSGSTGSAGTSGSGGSPLGGARQIYWVEHGSDTVNRSDSDGSNPDTLITLGTQSYLRSIAIDPGTSYLYYTDDEQSRIEHATLTGSNRGNTIASLDKPVGLDIDVEHGKLYFADQGDDPTIFRVNLDGSELEPLITSGIEHPYGVALDVAAGHLYLVDNGVNALFRANLDGSALTDLNVPDVDLPIQLSLDLGGGKLYWSEIGDVKRIRRANLDGSSPEVIVSAATFSNFTQPLGLKVDAAANALYFVDGSYIRRSKLDGSAVVTLLSGLDGPVGLALAY